jgi:hypothetical protein
MNITEIDPISGAPTSETNTIPYKNTTALINDLRDGGKFRFTVQVRSGACEKRGRQGGRPAAGTHCPPIITLPHGPSPFSFSFTP